MCLLTGWIFDSVLLAGVAITTHYCLVRYLDKKEPLPPIIQDALNSLKRNIGPAASQARERIENIDRTDIDSAVRKGEETIRKVGETLDSQQKPRNIRINILEE
ncbi:hypothetical protein WDU94_013144 [Cyamophila willieti]